jgi:hypothetical protein
MNKKMTTPRVPRLRTTERALKRGSYSSISNRATIPMRSNRGLMQN